MMPRSEETSKSALSMPTLFSTLCFTQIKITLAKVDNESGTFLVHSQLERWSDQPSALRQSSLPLSLTVKAHWNGQSASTLNTLTIVAGKPNGSERLFIIVRV
jgi:hypothetical protein